MTSEACLFIKRWLRGNSLGRRTFSLQNLENRGSSFCIFSNALEFIEFHGTSSCRWVILAITLSQRRVNLVYMHPTLLLATSNMSLHHKCTKKCSFSCTETRLGHKIWQEHFSLPTNHIIAKKRKLMWGKNVFICWRITKWALKYNYLWDPSSPLTVSVSHPLRNLLTNV